MQVTHGIRFHQTQFWVIHRRTEYGPFDYDWSPDLRGLELLYRGVKFGEICDWEELYADMKEFHLPLRVVHVASVVMGCIALSISRGYDATEREELLNDTLKVFDCHRFVSGDGENAG